MGCAVLASRAAPGGSCATAESSGANASGTLLRLGDSDSRSGSSCVATAPTRPFISGTHDDMIIGNVVTDIAGNGISIGKFAASDTTEYHVPYNPTDKNEICTSDTIKDNYIHHVTTEFQGGTGIAAGYPRLIDIQHNEVAYTNYTAISVGYGWTSTVNAMATNKINNNDIHHAVQILADGAGIYTLSNQQPS